MRIKGKITKEFNRTLEKAYVEISDVKVSRPTFPRGFWDTTTIDERELFNTLSKIENLHVYGSLPNFKVELDDVVEIEGSVELVDNMWFLNDYNLINVEESGSHDERLHQRFVAIAGARPVEKW